MKTRTQALLRIGEWAASIADVGDLDKEADAVDCASRPLLEEVGMEAGELTRLLDDIPGAWESAELGRIQAATGQAIPLRAL